MSFTHKLKQRLAQMQEAANGLVAEDATANARMDICRGCPHFIKLTSQCKKCGCFMAAKTKIQSATCPVNKW